MKKLILFLMLVMLGFGLPIQTAHAVDATPLTEAPIPQGVEGFYNARFAIAPYAQVVPNASYTFIGISHPSLATAHTSIGVAVEAMDMTTVPNNAAGRAAVFTVHAGTTHRVFIVNQDHASINVGNSAFADANTHLITTSNESQFGNIKVTGIGTSPNYSTPDTYRVGGEYADGGNNVMRLDNVSQLSMWGVVYQSSNGAGFALEFIGDMHDSNSGGSSGAVVGSPHISSGHSFDSTQSVGVGRGIN